MLLDDDRDVNEWKDVSDEDGYQTARNDPTVGEVIYSHLVKGKSLLC